MMNKIIALLVFSFIILVSCNKELIKPSDNYGGDSFFKPWDETIVFDDPSSGLVTKVDSNQIVINGKNDKLDSIKIGSVILSGPCEDAPAGFLRKVTAVNRTGNTITLETEYANLPDAFSEFRWSMAASVNGSKFRDEAEITPEAYDTTFTVKLGEVAGSDVNLDMTLRFEYTLELISEVDYTFTQGVTNARFGFDNLRVTELSFTKSFNWAGGDSLSSHFPFDKLQKKLDKDFVSLELAPIPIGPPPTPIYVRPVINLKGIFGVTAEADYSNYVKFYNTTPARGILVYNNGSYTVDGQLPGGLACEVGIGVHGNLAIETGLRAEFGLAPYTRSLFTTGIGLNNSLINTIDGRFNVTFNTDNGATLDAGIVYTLDAKTAGDIYVDGEFFGFIPEELDAAYTVYDYQTNLYTNGVQIVTCFTTFENVYGAIDCDGNNYKLYYSALAKPQIANRGDRYKLELRNENQTVEIAEEIPFGQSFNFNLTGFTPTGLDSLIYTHYENVDGLLEERECIRKLYLRFRNCNGTGNNPCLPHDVTQLYGHPYCIFNDDELGNEWIGSNLTYHINSDHSCYNDNLDNCEILGGLYNWETARAVCPSGWHISTLEEWDGLLRSLATSVDTVGEKIIYSNAAYELKDPDQWGGGTQSALNFNAIPAGYADPNGKFSHLGTAAYFWTETEADNSENGYAVIFSEGNHDVIISPNVKTDKFSCRCVKD